MLASESNSSDRDRTNASTRSGVPVVQARLRYYLTPILLRRHLHLLDHWGLAGRYVVAVPSGPIDQPGEASARPYVASETALRPGRGDLPSHPSELFGVAVGPSV